MENESDMKQVKCGRCGKIAFEAKTIEGIRTGLVSLGPCRGCGFREFNLE